MTTGALIFAQNNGLVDYVKLAVFAASRIKKYLNIPDVELLRMIIIITQLLQLMQFQWLH